MTRPVRPNFASDEYVRRWLADPALTSALLPTKQCHESSTGYNDVEALIRSHTQAEPDPTRCQESGAFRLPKQQQQRLTEISVENAVQDDAPPQRKFSTDGDARQIHGATSHELDPSFQYARRPRRKTRPEKYDYKGHEQEKRAQKNPAAIRRSWRNKSGDALNRDFKAPNVESKRLTLNYRTAPGFLSKGRASAPMPHQGLLDLTFSETTFLSKRRELDGAKNISKHFASSASDYQYSQRSDDSQKSMNFLQHRLPSTRSHLPQSQAHKGANNLHHPVSSSGSCISRAPSPEKDDKDIRVHEKSPQVEHLEPPAHRQRKYYSLEDLKQLAGAGSCGEQIKHDRLPQPVDHTLPFITKFQNRTYHDSSCDEQLADKVNGCAAGQLSNLTPVRALSRDRRFHEAPRSDYQQVGNDSTPFHFLSPAFEASVDKEKYFPLATDEQSSDTHRLYKHMDRVTALSASSRPWSGLPAHQQHRQQSILADSEAIHFEGLDQSSVDVPNLYATLNDLDLQPYPPEYMTLYQNSGSANHQMLNTSSPADRLDAFDSALLASISRQRPRSCVATMTAQEQRSPNFEVSPPVPFNNRDGKNVQTRVPTASVPAGEMSQGHVVFDKSGGRSRPRLMRPSEETVFPPEPFTCLFRSHILY